MTALMITAHDLATALVGGATFGKLSPARWVEDVQTGERLGWFRDDRDMVEWSAVVVGGFSRGGWAADEAEALQRICDVLSEARGGAPVEIVRREMPLAAE